MFQHLFDKFLEKNSGRWRVFFNPLTPWPSVMKPCVHVLFVTIFFSPQFRQEFYSLTIFTLFLHQSLDFPMVSCFFTFLSMHFGGMRYPLIEIKFFYFIYFIILFVLSSYLFKNGKKVFSFLCVFCVLNGEVHRRKIRVST